MQVPIIIIRNLLKGKHIGIEERIRRSAPITATLKYSDIRKVLIEMINETVFFPYNPNDLEYKNYEGLYIEKRSSKFICHAQRLSPINPDIIIEKSTKEFDVIDEVADYYLKWALNLPGNLDGYKVVE